MIVQSIPGTLQRPPSAATIYLFKVSAEPTRKYGWLRRRSEDKYVVLIRHIGNATLILTDSADALPTLSNIDACVTDPPYGLSFMGAKWDYQVPQVDFWKLVHATLKPGAHLLSFFGSRTYHRGCAAIEDGGFDIRDQMMWLYGTGFPKSLDVSKAIDRAAGAERQQTPTLPMLQGSEVGSISKNLRCAVCGKPRASGNPCVCPRLEDVPASDAAKQWQGWGTALKPAHEPIVMARKPLTSTVASNVLEHATGALNIDGCRVHADWATDPNKRGWQGGGTGAATFHTERPVIDEKAKPHALGRWPANVLHDGSDAVTAEFPVSKDGVATNRNRDYQKPRTNRVQFTSADRGRRDVTYGGAGSAARFFYCAKPSKAERGEGNAHPTVKPVALMRYLCRLVTPPGGIVLDPFMGSGTTGVAALAEGFRFVGIECDPDYFEIACNRIAEVQGIQRN